VVARRAGIAKDAAVRTSAKSLIWLFLIMEASCLTVSSTFARAASVGLVKADPSMMETGILGTSSSCGAFVV
jgi:hypothetical protein